MQRLKAYITISFAYIFACALACVLFVSLTAKDPDTTDIIIALLIADITATVIIWGFGLGFKNSSFYDPYWSLIPWLMVLAVMIRFDKWSLNNILFLAIFGIWSWRLTINWAYTCESIKTQDWRYTMYKQQNNTFMWHVINFFGINLMPTLLVFAALIPAIVTVLINTTPNGFSFVGAAIILLGTVLEFFADIQMHSFRKSNRDKNRVQDTGLWKYSRHPNYLGEISVWIGVFVFMLSADISKWYLITGALLMLGLFYFISIPMMEKRQKSKRPDYKLYQQTTSKLLLLPPKRL